MEKIIIWYITYNVTKMSYSMNKTGNVQWVDLTIRRFEITKESPKYYYVQCNVLSTYHFWKNKLSNRDFWIKKYKKENVNITEVETKDYLIDRLNKIIDFIEKSDDITNNHKNAYKTSYDLIIEYLRENNF